jgi:hypothetical protein
LDGLADHGEVRSVEGPDETQLSGVELAQQDPFQSLDALSLFGGSDGVGSVDIRERRPSITSPPSQP